ncbi:uncharacterized protein LOC116296990 [Actinia tenebrosa]|uniref:Uncharacterized protein LOC116296990 n=1 Tax=Actinia tenebrosa TaxID=6105 RepID=A0A6P8I0C8_ACTTE|nr:uncharacterized protein LOC116296990 [Actinia tenebrosa]
MAAVDNRELSSDLYEQSKPTASASVSAPSIDLSCIHWGYLNSALVPDKTKKVKELTWKTYWVDLCGSTLRLYRDLSLSPELASSPPPSKVIGPTAENEKKEAFLVLKKGASISIWDSTKVKTKKKSRKSEPPKYNVFKLQVVNCIDSPVYLFEAPSKGSMYRWISKIEEGIDMANNPQNNSNSDKKLQEAKLLAIESRRYQTVAPELKYSDVKDDTDSGMEGDEESYEVPEKPPPDPRLEKLLKTLKIKQELLKILEEGERAFIGNGESGEMIEVSEFKSRTKMDYYLIPGYTSSLIPQNTQINILGQLPNKRWRCYVDLPKTSTQTTQSASTESDVSSLSDSRSSTPSCENGGSLLSFENNGQAAEETERLIGSVPTSLLVDLSEMLTVPFTEENLVVLGTPDVTPNPSPLPSPPLSPYSTHKYKETPNDSKENFESFQRRSPTNLQRFVPSMDLSDVDAWEQFILPSPPSTPVTSSSSTPSLSPSQSLENVDSSEGEKDGLMSDDVPVTIVDQDERFPNNSSDTVQHSAVMRLKDEEAFASQKNYSFLVTKKLRQRGISLIVGSSSSEDEDEDEEKGKKLTRRKLDEEFERFAADDTAQATVRPYSAFVPRKSTSIGFGISSKTANLRTTTNDELLRDYSSSNVTRSKTCMTLKNKGRFRTPENAPPLNQRRTIQMQRSENGGFGFTLQTYGIVQLDGEVEYMTFVLAVEEDGPAYMAGMRPGDIIIVIESQDTEEADHKTIIELLQKAPATVRMVVVFVDAIRRMHLNTKIKVLKSELEDKEDEFNRLSQKEHELVTHKNTVTNLDILGPPRSRDNSYLYTTELTSSFSKDSPKVKDSLIKYKQELDEKQPRRQSLPDRSELKKRHLVSTTGNELLKSFASSAESMLKKSASVKLKRKVMKAKPTSKTFKSYIDLDDGDFQDEGPLRTSSPLGTKITKDTEQLRLSWPTSTPGMLAPSAEQEDKTRSLPNNTGGLSSSPVNGNSQVKDGKGKSKTSNTARDLCTSPGHVPSEVRDDQETKPLSLKVKGLGSLTANGPNPGKSSLVVKESETAPVKESSKLTATDTAAETKRTLTKDTSINDNNSVSNDAGIDTPSTGVSKNRDIMAVNNVQSSRTNDDRGGLENNQNKKSDKKDVNVKSGENSSSLTRDSENANKPGDENLINNTSNTEKCCPNVNAKKEDSNRIKLSDSHSPTLLQKSPKVPRMSKPYSLMSGSSSKDRPCSNNIASLRRIFEGPNPPCNRSPDIVEDEERDAFPTDIKKDNVIKPPPEFAAKPRMGSMRPMSFMCAMDAAEESPLIPDEETENKEGQKIYESSA